jgi:hypothetical protein
MSNQESAKLINHVLNKDYTGAKESLKSIIGKNVLARIAEKKMEIAQSMYGEGTETSIDEEDDDLDEKRMTAQEKEKAKKYRKSASGKKALARYKKKSSKAGYRVDPQRSKVAQKSARMRVEDEDQLDETKSLDEAALNPKKIIADYESGLSIDAVVGKHLNKKATNKDEILKVIRQYEWQKRKNKTESLDESVDKEIKNAIDDVFGSVQLKPVYKHITDKGAWIVVLYHEPTKKYYGVNYMNEMLERASKAKAKKWASDFTGSTDLSGWKE